MSERVFQKGISEKLWLREAVQCEILSFSPSTYSESSTSSLEVKCSLPSEVCELVDVKSVPLFSFFFLMLYH